jgi:hypothetical protein
VRTPLAWKLNHFGLALVDYSLDIGIANRDFEHFVRLTVSLQVLSSNPGDQSRDFKQSYRLGLRVMLNDLFCVRTNN